MFTVKAVDHSDVMQIVQGEKVEVKRNTKSTIVTVQNLSDKNAHGGTYQLRVAPSVVAPYIGEDVELFKAVFVENAAGATTEIIRAPA